MLREYPAPFPMESCQPPTYSKYETEIETLTPHNQDYPNMSCDVTCSLMDINNGIPMKCIMF